MHLVISLAAESFPHSCSRLNRRYPAHLESFLLCLRVLICASWVLGLRWRMIWRAEERELVVWIWAPLSLSSMDAESLLQVLMVSSHVIGLAEVVLGRIGRKVVAASLQMKPACES